jgi:MinD superfamily P-loop ATPase
MDNEAGLEHVARGTLPHVDTMLLISDCSRRGIQAAARVAEMVEEMNLNPGQMGLIVNRAPNGVLDDGIRAEIEKRHTDNERDCRDCKCPSFGWGKIKKGRETNDKHQKRHGYDGDRRFF